ncbi:hypothetical protein COCON_G00162930 [Conger conger]|uniref:Protein kinase domain-containing protein n=1 Tax=Conger conger TaxID=82655 RepID=A0A9Q1HTD3_CONCO|nr:hypothetical protein COCON_G00162930 [Conger conger]
MSVCGEFAEHRWKSGSCKNCFHPRSAHRPNGGAVRTRISPAGDDEDGLTLSASYCKPTIAVRPTVMNPELAEVRPDPLNVNSEQDNQKSPLDKLSLKKMLDLFIDNNGCSKDLKEAVLQNTGKMDYARKLSANTVSPPCLQKVFVTQEVGHGPYSLQENGTSDGYRPQTNKTTKSTYAGSNSRDLRGAVLERAGFDGDSDVLHDASSAQESQAALEIAIDIITTIPTKIGSSDDVEASSTFPSSGFFPDSGRQGSRPGDGASSFLSEPASLSDSSSYQSSTDSLSGSQGLDVFGPSGLDRPQALPSSSDHPSDTGNADPNPEPIYAESTKRKRKTEVDGKASGAEAGLTGEGQRATITVMAAHTEENNRTFYLSSPDSAVSTQWPHFSPTSSRNPSSPTFKWPSSSMGSEGGVASLQPKPQASPPIPPKRNSRSPKLGTSSLSPVACSELRGESSTAPHTSSPTPSVPQGEALTSSSIITTLERRHKPYGSTWNREGRIEEEEEGGEEATAQTVTSGPINGAAVSEPADWSPAAYGRESTPPGTANNGASQKHPGGGEEKSKRSEDMLAKATSFTADLSEGKCKSHDPAPPPPPPKKHQRASGKMSQSSTDLEQVCQQGSVERLAQSPRGLRGGQVATSSDSLHSDSKMPSDGGLQDALSPSPFPSSPLTGSPVSPYPDPFLSASLGRQVQPPPLPEKKTVSRTLSAPAEAAGSKHLPRTPKWFPLSGSEDNVSRPSCALSSPGDRRNQYSSSESLEHLHPPLNRSLRSRTLDEPPAGGRGRLGGYCRGAVTSSSSPQLSAPASGSSLQLHALLSNIDSREGVYAKLGGLYAESLRRLTLKCEEHFTRSQRSPMRFDESNWSLFKLTCNKPCCEAGDAVYYSASCASDPSNLYAVKICKNQTPDAKQGHLYGLSVQQGVPPHFNLQQDCGHFIACVPLSMLPPDEAAGPGAQREPEQERVVVVTREVPQHSAADFVREWAAFHRAQPEAYERRVCFLLLQLCSALEHLKEHGVSHRDLCLENLLLVPHRRAPPDDREQKRLPRLLVASFGKAKRRGPDDLAADPRLKRDRARLAPEIVSAAQYRKFDEFQTGILIYELLHQPNPFEVSPKLKEQDYACGDLPPIPHASLYSAGLQRLAQLLLQPDPIKRIHIQEAKRALQSLLWGPRRDLMEQQGEQAGVAPRHEGLLNWLDVKRALLMMKFAERCLEPGHAAELEDWLCCQYFSSAHPLSLCHTAELLYGLK